MGTTVTPNLGLIKPDVAEKIQEDLPAFPGWAAQNEINCDKIDALFRDTTHTQSPAPTWVTDISSNPVLGSGGFVETKYIRLWPRMVIGYTRISAGTTGFSAGSGLYRVQVPCTVAPELTGMALNIPVGKAYLHDASHFATATVMVMLYDIANNVFTFRRHNGDFWRHDNPIALAQNDRLSAFFMYPTTDA